MNSKELTEKLADASELVTIYKNLYQFELNRRCNYKKRIVDWLRLRSKTEPKVTCSRLLSVISDLIDKDDLPESETIEIKSGDLKLQFRKLSDFDKDCLMTINSWMEGVRSGLFVDYDGYGDLATANHKSNLEIVPSTVTNNKNKNWTPPDWATHICWYNK